MKKMKLTKLVIQNFLSIQNATLYLADKGLVSIEGVNEDATGSDSNGCGKSSIINSILWCVYGSCGKETTADSVVNSKANKDCSVESEWRHDDTVVIIRRYRNHTRFKNAVRVIYNGSDITKAGSVAVQQQINEIMGADEMIFRASCFAQQENPLDIPAMTDTKLKALLEDCLPFDDLAPAFKKASEQVVTQKVLVDKLKREIELKVWQIDHCKKELKTTLDLRFNYAKKVEEGNVKIDKEIKLKNIARGVALSMSNEGTLLKDIEDLEFRIDAIGYSDHILASYKHNEAEKHVDALKYQLNHPVNTCKECGQEVEDLAKVRERIQDKLVRAEADRDELRDKAKVAAYNHKQKSILELELKRREHDLTEVNRNKEAADRLEAEIRLLEGQKRPLGTNPHQATVERFRGNLKAAISGKESYENDLKKEQERLEILEAVQHTYSPKGLRYHMLESVAPRLTADTNKYLNILTDGAIQAVWSTVSKLGSGEFKEKFSIEAIMEGRSNFGLLSGGEKRKVRLACFFALQDLIASQATKDIQLWCGDEIDVALDGAGMERLMGILAEKTKTKSTILVISHNEMREWIPNYATVTRKDGVSTITGYLNNVD
jgi:DNA repair exonuclease SbcCD ATPase subunit